MGRKLSSLAAPAAVTSVISLLLLFSHSATQAFQPVSQKHHFHHPLASAVAGNEETTVQEVVISPITGSETNIKYPTKRGSEVDSRKIINYNVNNDNGDSDNNGGSPLLALRLSHILFASKELASQTLDKLTKSEWNFEQMASSVSNCAEC